MTIIFVFDWSFQRCSDYKMLIQYSVSEWEFLVISKTIPRKVSLVRANMRKYPINSACKLLQFKKLGKLKDCLDNSIVFEEWTPELVSEHSNPVAIT